MTTAARNLLDYIVQDHPELARVLEGYRPLAERLDARHEEVLPRGTVTQNNAGHPWPPPDVMVTPRSDVTGGLQLTCGLYAHDVAALSRAMIVPAAYLADLRAALTPSQEATPP